MNTEQCERLCGINHVAVLKTAASVLVRLTGRQAQVPIILFCKRRREIHIFLKVLI